MKRALRTALILLAVFAGAALILGLLVDFDAGDVRRWLVASRERPGLVFAAVVALLAVDSVLTVPTIGTVLAAGYLLGPFWGALGSFTGMMLAGSICYWGGRIVGSRRWTSSDAAVSEVGPAALLVARSAPMLPEVVSAMAGSGRMRPHRYYLYFGLGNLPFAVLVAYAGSVSTLERPWPAIVAGVAVPAAGAAFVLWRRFSSTRRSCATGR
ncbi:MAG TPA: VTT domain-containing protein [Polyangiaceae bacterium]|nr:VTT domain-containing protein [Polyangiaceae bacterium]